MKLKDSLTILIPLWNRNKSTKIILTYMDTIGVPFKILMADGGSNDNSHWIKQDNFPNLNLEYKYYGFDSSINKFMRKMDLSCSSITTPLTIMLDNDDFFSLGGLIAGVEFLANNDDFASFRESVYDYYGDSDIYTSQSIISDSPTQRVIGLFEQGRVNGGINSAWHDMFRTHVLQNMFQIMYQSDSEDFQLSHSVNKFWSLFYGKAHKGHSQTYIYHVSGNSLVQGKGLYSKYKDWMYDSKFKNSMAIIASSVKGILRDYDDSAINNIQALIIQDPYQLSGHPVASDDTIDDIITHSLTYDELVTSVFDQPIKTPVLFRVDDPVDFELGYNEQLIKQLLE